MCKPWIARIVVIVQLNLDDGGDRDDCEGHTETRLYDDGDKDIRYDVNAYHVNESLKWEAGLMTSRAHYTLV